MRNTLAFIVLIFSGACVAAAVAQAPDGAAVYQASCASCHADPGPDSRAPNRAILATLAPESIVVTLTSGQMFRQGAALTDAERKAVAGFLAGRPVGTAAPAPTAGLCSAKAPAITAEDIAGGWNGWGSTAANNRFQSAEKSALPASAIPRLKLKWAFGFQGVSSARSQPAIVGGRMFVGSESGDLFALNARTGCVYWIFHTKAGIRTAPSVGPYRRANGTSAFAVYLADGAANAYAVDTETGQEIWSRRVDDHVYAKSTGSLTYYDGRVYVPVAGVGEEGQGGSPAYACCTFRGSLSALDASTGAVIWKTYTVDEPKPRGKSKEGAQLWGPAGAGIWSAPTVDPGRRAIYAATGNAYAEPNSKNSDAVVAFDLDSGRILWTFQPTIDVWVGGCRTGDGNPNCPATVGADHDFSMSPALVRRSNGADLLIVQQKSGMAYAIDPARQGALVWQYKTSDGAGLGGQWGAATDGDLVYFSVNGPASAAGGLRAVNLETGAAVWSKNAEARLCGNERGCSAAQGAAVTAIPGIVFSVSMDGGLRAHAAADGTTVWSFNTNRDFETVNGVKAKGGAMDGPGAVVSGGMVYVNSGYVSLIGRPGNVLLAFAVE
ncbi:MAG TPA: PQQ-binding-like beta-propeller repeat protein [Terriglobia bacterium]|nr:PQQ-binding-like beta-propeller repeat protein [Terriglobia bacterium]